MSDTATTPLSGDPVVAPADPVRSDPRRYRDAAYEHGAAAALVLLHTEAVPGVLPAGPGGHVFVPLTVEAVCDRHETPTGPRARESGAAEEFLGRIPSGEQEMIALRVAGSGPVPAGDTPGAWPTGLAWIRLGLADRLVEQAAAHLRGRTVQNTVTLNLALVRAMLADAVGGTTEARALLGGPPTARTLRRVHRSLDETGRICLHLFGATGYLTGGPGSEVRVSELLADTYAPSTDPERP
ncbi:hypothetical protein [Streptomyces sp. AK02-01A]|uniref:hypothetical protein n=1 Tax=Streptomyces sp. AK02-01A TaxID=3028648 RepID=UPI0029A0A73C|nr:hypothetical protein [Streptomyces sp. AK02-01A]MDX3854834.1 hypothetical protein [Streptomyces sp. AK02-01A]